MTTKRATSYILLAETVTEAVDGELTEGTHGLMVDDDVFIDMAGIIGPTAGLLLEGAHAETADIVEWEWDPVKLAESHLGALDYLDWRDGELIAYAADLPRVDVDEPYVRAIAVRYVEVEEREGR